MLKCVLTPANRILPAFLAAALGFEQVVGHLGGVFRLCRYQMSR